MNISACTELKNENISCDLTELLKKELRIDGVQLVITLDTNGQLNIGFPKNVKVVRAEEVLSKLQANKVTNCSFVTGIINPPAGVFSSGGWSVGFLD